MAPQTTPTPTVTRTVLTKRLIAGAANLALATALALGLSGWWPVAVEQPFASMTAVSGGGAATPPSGRIDTPPEPELVIYLVTTAAEAEVLEWGLVRNPAAEQPALRALALAAGTAHEAAWAEQRIAELRQQRLGQGLPPARLIDLRHQGDRASRSRPDGA